MSCCVLWSPLRILVNQSHISIKDGKHNPQNEAQPNSVGFVMYCVAIVTPSLERIKHHCDEFQT